MIPALATTFMTRGRRPRMRGAAGTILLGFGVLSVAGCSGGSSGGASPPKPTAAGSAASTSAPAAMPASFKTVGGTAYRFGLPTSPEFVLDEQRVTDNGSLVKRWRYAVTPNGPFCLAEAVEQADFTGQFPESVVELFAANTQPDQHTLRTEVMKPNPPGTIGGVDQESTFTGRLDDGTTFPSHFYQHKYLTPGHSLIALAVAGPEANSAQCQLATILSTFSATGQEFTPATPEPSTSGPGPSATATDIFS
jgi:hypothetical protein